MGFWSNEKNAANGKRSFSKFRFRDSFATLSPGPQTIPKKTFFSFVDFLPDKKYWFSTTWSCSKKIWFRCFSCFPIKIEATKIWSLFLLGPEKCPLDQFFQYFQLFRVKGGFSQALIIPPCWSGPKKIKNGKMERVEKLMQSWPQFSQSGSRKKMNMLLQFWPHFKKLQKLWRTLMQIWPHFRSSTPLWGMTPRAKNVPPLFSSWSFLLLVRSDMRFAALWVT